MRRSVAAAALALVLAVLAACGGGGGGGSGGASAQDRLPDLAVERLGGASADGAIRLRSLVDGPTVVNLWAPWCVPCRREMPAFEKVHASTPSVRFVGLASRGDEEASLEFARSLGVTYDLVVDRSGDAFAELGASSLPMTLFVDADGRVVERHLGTMTEAALREKVAALAA